MLPLYQVGPHQAKKKPKSRWLIFLFILMVLLISTGFFFYLKIEDSKFAYQKAYTSTQFEFETPLTKEQKVINFLVIGIDYLEEERLSSKQVTSLNIISKQGKSLTIYPIDPSNLSEEELVWNEQMKLESINQVGSTITDKIDHHINYTLLVDLDKFNEFFENRDPQTFLFSKEYSLPQFTIPGNVPLELTNRQISHSMFPVDSESYLDYNRRQIEIVAQTYQTIVQHFYSTSFEINLGQFFPLMTSNIPMSYLIEDGIVQIFNQPYKIIWQEL